MGFQQRQVFLFLFSLSMHRRPAAIDRRRPLINQLIHERLNLVLLDCNPRRHGLTWVHSRPGFLTARYHRWIYYRRPRPVLHRSLRHLPLASTRATSALLGTLAQAAPLPLDLPRRGEHGPAAAELALFLRGQRRPLRDAQQLAASQWRQRQQSAVVLPICIFAAAGLSAAPAHGLAGPVVPASPIPRACLRVGLDLPGERLAAPVRRIAAD